MKILIILTLCFSLFPHSKAVATVPEWIINRDHSEILFQVPYLSVSEVTGRFSEFDGKVTFGDATPKSILIRIQAASIETGNKMRDGHLKGSEFFKSKEYPLMVFESTSIQRKADGGFKASGKLTMKDITRPLSVEFTITDSVKDTWGYENKFVKYKGKLNRREYKIDWNKTLDKEQYLVGDEITLWGVFQIQPNDGKTPPSKHMIPDTEYIREREIKNREKEESGFSQRLRKLINGN